jgi:hypothetical protein
MAMTDDMKRCIEDCLRCYGVCTNMAMNHCLELGGEHVEPKHFRLWSRVRRCAGPRPISC